MPTNKRTQELLLVEDIIEILQISRTNAYQLIHNHPPFKIITIGRLKRIHAKSFFTWLDGETDCSESIIHHTSAQIA